MSFINWGSESPEQLKIRKQLEEQMLFEQAMQSAAMAASAGVGSGGGRPRSIVQSAQSILISYENSETGNVAWFTVNYEGDTPSFSDPYDTGIPMEGVQDIFADELIDRGCYLLKVRANNKNNFFFIDAAGNLVQKIENIDSEYSTSFGGLALALQYYTGNTSIVLKWWSGDYLYTRTFNDVVPSSYDANWFDNDRVTLDGTFSFYYNSTLTGSTRVYLANSKTGNITEITEALSYNNNGTNTYTNGMYQAGNFVYATFIDSSTIDEVYDCTLGDNFITLSTPNPNIRIGDTIVGPGIADSCVVSEINGSVVTFIGDPIESTESGETATFSSNQIQLLRVIKTDGTYRDYDLSTYHSTSIANTWLVGTDKLVLFLGAAATGLDFALCIYNNTSETLSVHTDDSSIYTDRTALYSERPILYNNILNGGPAASNNFVLLLHGTYSNDNIMDRYQGPSVKFIWTGSSTTGYYEMEVALGEEETFGFTRNTNPNKTGVFFANSPESSNIELLYLEPDGEWQFVNTSTLYMDAGNYFEVNPLGDGYALLSYYDNSKLNDEVQYINVLDLSTLTFVGDNIWMTIYNGWSTNKDTFFLRQDTENLTYWFNSSAAVIDTIEGKYDESYLSESNSSSSYVDYQRTGTTALYYADLNKLVILSSNFIPPAEVDITGKPHHSIRVSENLVYYLWVDEDNSTYKIDVYSLEGELVLNVETGVTEFNRFEVYHDRAYFSFIDDGSINLIAIMPEAIGVIQYLAAGSEININDWRWFD